MYLAFSKKCYETFIPVYRELSHEWVPLTLVNFKFVTMYKATLDEELRAGHLTLCTRLLSGELQHFESYCRDFYNAVFALLEKVRSAATAASFAFREVLLTQVPSHVSRKRATI